MARATKSTELVNVAQAAYANEDPVMALGAAICATEAAHAVGNLPQTSVAFAALSHVLEELGDPVGAMRCLNLRLRINRMLRDRLEVGLDLYRLGELHVECGNVPSAFDAWQESVEILREFEGAAGQLRQAERRLASMRRSCGYGHA